MSHAPGGAEVGDIWGTTESSGGASPLSTVAEVDLRDMVSATVRRGPLRGIIGAPNYGEEVEAMQNLRDSSLFRLGAPQFAVGVALGLAVGAAIAILLSSGSEESAIFSVGDRVALTIPGQTGGGGGFLTGSGVSIEIPTEELLLTAPEAVAMGWKDPVLCTPGRGRYFKRDTGGEKVPYLLMYDDLGSLIGIYQISETEMPTPWKHVDALEGGGLTIVDFQHWGLFVYFRDQVLACGAAEKGRATYGYREGRFGSQTRGTPTPVLPPTPTPSPSGLLEAAAQNLSSLTSFSFTLTHEGGNPEGRRLGGPVGRSGPSVE